MPAGSDDRGTSGPTMGRAVLSQSAVGRRERTLRDPAATDRPQDSRLGLFRFCAQLASIDGSIGEGAAVQRRRVTSSVHPCSDALRKKAKQSGRAVGCATGKCLIRPTDRAVYFILAPRSCVTNWFTRRRWNCGNLADRALSEASCAQSEKPKSRICGRPCRLGRRKVRCPTGYRRIVREPALPIVGPIAAVVAAAGIQGDVIVEIPLTQSNVPNSVSAITRPRDEKSSHAAYVHSVRLPPTVLPRVPSRMCIFISELGPAVWAYGEGDGREPIFRPSGAGSLPLIPTLAPWLYLGRSRLEIAINNGRCRFTVACYAGRDLSKGAILFRARNRRYGGIRAGAFGDEIVGTDLSPLRAGSLLAYLPRLARGLYLAAPRWKSVTMVDAFPVACYVQAGDLSKASFFEFGPQVWPTAGALLTDCRE